MNLYTKLEQINGDRRWGRMLDAGTGPASMRWVQSLDTKSWVAVTGSKKMHEKVSAQAAPGIRHCDNVVLGNWMEPDLLSGQVYDTVLADYLLGAIEGFAPYWQDQLFRRLRPHVGQRLYIVGLEPYVPYLTDDPAGKLIVEIGRVRDACLLLGRDHPYREFPMDWALRNLVHSGYRVLDAQRYPIRYGEKFINSQLDMSSAVLNYIKDRSLALAMQQHIADLRRRALSASRQLGGLEYGHDYVIVAEPYQE